MSIYVAFDDLFLRSPQVLAFGEHMDALGLAYTHRLGEQVCACMWVQKRGWGLDKTGLAHRE